MDVGTVVLKLFATILLVFLNSFFVASEFALVRVRRTQLEPMRSDSRAKRARYAVEHLDLYLAATQLGVTMASLGLGWLGEPALGGLIAQGLAAAQRAAQPLAGGLFSFTAPAPGLPQAQAGMPGD